MNLVRAATLMAIVAIFTTSAVEAKKSKKKLGRWNCIELLTFSVTAHKIS